MLEPNPEGLVLPESRIARPGDGLRLVISRDAGNAWDDYWAWVDYCALQLAHNPISRNSA